MNTPSPAALYLLGRGVTGRALAEALDLTPQAVSFQLAGKAAETSPELLDAVEELTGLEAREAVADIIAGLRARRLA